MNNSAPIVVEVIVNAPMERVWEFWTKPEHITKWAFASDDWEAPSAENDVRTGGKFKTRMSPRPGSGQAGEGFDFAGTYTAVKEHELIEYDMDIEPPSPNAPASRGRHVKIEFVEMPEGVRVTESFEPESENPLEVQKNGWQAILENFKKYAERA